MQEIHFFPRRRTVDASLMNVECGVWADYSVIMLTSATIEGRRGVRKPSVCLGCEETEVVLIEKERLVYLLYYPAQKKDKYRGQHAVCEKADRSSDTNRSSEVYMIDCIKGSIHGEREPFILVARKVGSSEVYFSLHNILPV